MKKGCYLYKIAEIRPDEPELGNASGGIKYETDK